MALDSEKYIEDGYIDTSYFGNLVELEIDLSHGYITDDYFVDGYFEPGASANFILTATSGETKFFAVDLTSSASLTAELSELVDFELSMVGVAELSVESVVTRSTPVALNSAFTQSEPDPVKYVPGAGAFNSAFTQLTNGGFFLTGSTTQSSAFAVVSPNTRQRNTEVALTGLFTQLAAAGQLLSDTANLSAAFSTTAELNTIFRSDVDVGSAFGLSTTPSGIFPSSADFNSAFSTTTTGLRILPLAADLNSAFETGHEENGGLGTGIGTDVVFSDGADLTGVFAPNISVNITRTTDTDLSSAFSIDVDNTRTRSTPVDLTSEFTVSPTLLLIKDLKLHDLDVEFNQTVDGIKLVTVEVALSGAFAPSITANITRTTDTDLSSTFGLSVDPVYRAEGQILTNSDFSVVSSLTGVVVSGADFDNTFTISATGGFFQLSTERTYIIPTEHRLFAVEPENKTYTVAKETREYTIQGGE